jgi:hypothetical protein
MSLHAQETSIVDYCAQRRYHLIKLYKDILYDESIERPELQLILKELNSGEIMMVADLTSISKVMRNALNIIDPFIERKVEFIAIPHPFDITIPAGHAAMNIQLACNELERETGIVINLFDMTVPMAESATVFSVLLNHIRQPGMSFESLTQALKKQSDKSVGHAEPISLPTFPQLPA